MATVSENLIALQNAKLAIKEAITAKGQDLTNVPFTKYADKIVEIKSGGVEMTSGSFTMGGVYNFPPFAHGLSKPPKLVFCFLKGYETNTGVYNGGFVYTEKASSLYRFTSTTEPTMGVVAVTKPNSTPAYGAISVDDDNVCVSSASNQWTAGDYEWEAYTW